MLENDQKRSHGLLRYTKLHPRVQIKTTLGSDFGAKYLNQSAPICTLRKRVQPIYNSISRMQGFLILASLRSARTQDFFGPFFDNLPSVYCMPRKFSMKRRSNETTTTSLKRLDKVKNHRQIGPLSPVSGIEM